MLERILENARHGAVQLLMEPAVVLCSRRGDKLDDTVSELTSLGYQCERFSNDTLCSSDSRPRWLSASQFACWPIA